MTCGRFDPSTATPRTAIPIPEVFLGRRVLVRPYELSDAAAAGAMECGFSGVKIKIGARFGFDSKDVSGDESLVRTVREAIGPRAELLVDANSGYSVHTAIKVGRMLERYDAFHFEEPIPFTDVDGMAQIAAALDIPLAAGEQHTRYDFKELLARGAVDIVQPDVTKCGGLSEGKKIAVLADAFGKYVTTHNTSTGLGLVAHLHFWASTPACRYAQEYNIVSGLASKERLVATPLIPENGSLIVPHGPGFGVEINQDLIDRYATT